MSYWTHSALTSGSLILLFMAPVKLLTTIADLVDAIPIAVGESGQTRTSNSHEVEADTCQAGSHAEYEPDRQSGGHTGELLQCVLRAIQNGLSESSPDATVPITRIQVGIDVQCALGELRIGAFVSDDPKCVDPRRDTTVSIDVDSVLVRLYDRYVREPGRTDPQGGTGRLLQHLLDVRGLNQPLRAVVRSGFVLSDVSTDGDSVFAKDVGGGAIDWGAELPTILWETATYKGLSLSGGIGQRDVLGVWVREEDDGAERLIVRSVDGVYYDLFLNLHLIHPKSQLIDVFVGVGQERVANFTLADSIPLRLADNRVGPWSLRGEFGVRYRIYTADRVDIEYGRHLPTPALEVAAGIRRHERFRASGELGFLRVYPTPRDRLFWRFGMDLGSSFGNTNGEQNAWSFVLVAEQEMVWPDSPIPTYTRFFIVGTRSLFARW